MGSLRRSPAVVHDADELRKRLREDGYLYLPGLLDADAVREVAGRLTTELVGAGWLRDADSRAVRDEVAEFDREEFFRSYQSVQKVEQLHRLAFSTELHALMERVFGTAVFTYPYKVVRLAVPADEDGYFTNPHQDFVVLHLTSDVLTAWVPLTPCSPDSPGLLVLEGSHRDGFLLPDPGVGTTRSLYLDVPRDDPRWLGAEYEPGDVVVFHSLTVHASGANRTRGLRMSADFRFQRRDEPVRPQMANPYGWPTGGDWPELTQHWGSREWVALPDGVEQIDLPDGTALDDYLQTLVAPPSRLLGVD